ISTFYFLGRNSNISWRVLPKFAASIFVVGAAGFLLGVIVNLYVRQPGAVISLFSQSSLAEVIPGLILNGALILAVGFGSLSLGTVGVLGRRDQNVAARMRRSYVPIALGVFVVALVATSGVAAYAFVLNPELNAPKYTCIYQPGAHLYLRVVSDQSQAPLSGQRVTGKLVSACPVGYACTPSCPY